MSAPDDKAEGLNPLAERASGPESDYVAMKRYSVEHDAHGAYLRIFGNEVGPVRACGDSVYIASDADRGIATERRENSEAIAARDARIAELDEAVAVNGQMYRDEFKKRRKVEEALASRDAEIGRLREALQHIATGNRRYLANRVDSARLANGIAVIEVCAELAEAALTPPSQAPVAASLRGPEGEARRDVGGEKL